MRLRKSPVGPDGPTIAVGIVSHDRHAEVQSAVASAHGAQVEEIIVADSASTPPLGPVLGARVVRTEVNSAAGGRNLIVENVTSEVVFFIDDDAVLLPGAVERVRKAFRDDPTLGAVAAHLVRPDRDDVRIEQPFRAGRRVPDVDADCGYLIGAGCAIRTEVYRAVGGSDPRMQYGSDDVDLAMRIFQAGHRVRWLHGARVEHRPSTAGRMTSAVVAGSSIRARIWIARSFLPLPVAALHVGLWIGLTGRNAHRAGDLGEWWRWVKEGFALPVERRKMTLTQLVALHRCGGRVFF